MDSRSFGMVIPQVSQLYNRLVRRHDLRTFDLTFKGATTLLKKVVKLNDAPKSFAHMQF